MLYSSPPTETESNQMTATQFRQSPAANTNLPVDLAHAVSFNAASSHSGRSAASTEHARNIIGRIRTKRINILDDIDITREMSAEGSAIRVTTVNGVEVEQVGNRFSTSLAGVIGTSLSNLSWIGYKDMVQRIHGKEGKEVSLTVIESETGGPDEVLAMIPVKRVDKALPGIAEMVERLKPESIAYSAGRFILNRNPDSIQEFSIFGDQYSPSSHLIFPADNYGDARRFLGSLRQVCSNGMVLMSSDFEEVIKNSADKFSSVMGSLAHISESMLENLRKRLTVADSTLISGKEVNSLLSALMTDRRTYTKSQQYDDETREHGNTLWFDRIIQLEDLIVKDGVGGMSGILKGDLDILGAVDCKVSVIDAINMFTEISSHYIGAENSAVGYQLNGELNGAIGKLLSKKRFNLEGSKVASQRKDLWLAN